MSTVHVDRPDHRSVSQDLKRIRQKEARINQARQKIQERSAALQAEIHELQHHCSHMHTVEAKEPDSTSSMGYKVGVIERLCLDCGSREQAMSQYAGWRLLPNADTLVSWDEIRTRRPLGSRLFKMCRGSNHHSTYHMVPESQMLARTEYCTEHGGEACPSCKGRPHYHDPSGDGHGGLNGGSWRTCSSCGGRGIK